MSGSLRNETASTNTTGNVRGWSAISRGFHDDNYNNNNNNNNSNNGNNMSFTNYDTSIEPPPRWNNTIIELTADQKRSFNRNFSEMQLPRTIDYSNINSKTVKKESKGLVKFIYLFIYIYNTVYFYYYYYIILNCYYIYYTIS